LPALFEVLGQGFEHPAKDPFLYPLLKAAMAGLVGRVAFGKILPGRSGAQYPEDAIQDVAWVPPGSASPVFPSRRIRDKGLQYFPLLVREVHARLRLLPEGHTTAPLYPHSRIYEIASNHHVLGDRSAARASFVGFDYQVGLNGAILPPTTFAFDPDEFFFADEGLDHAVVAVRVTDNGEEPLSAFGWNPLFEEEGKAIVSQWLNLIQHPNGKPNSWAFARDTPSRPPPPPMSTRP
jgi:hypothetical protein